MRERLREVAEHPGGSELLAIEPELARTVTQDAETLLRVIQATGTAFSADTSQNEQIANAPSPPGSPSSTRRWS